MSVQVGGILHYKPFSTEKIMSAKLRKHVFFTWLLSCDELLMFLLPGPVCDLHFELLPQTDTSFSVTFQQPNTDALAVCEHLSYMY